MLISENMSEKARICMRCRSIVSGFFHNIHIDSTKQKTAINVGDFCTRT